MIDRLEDVASEAAAGELLLLSYSAMLPQIRVRTARAPRAGRFGRDRQLGESTFVHSPPQP